jgi:hypothetical protein
MSEIHVSTVSRSSHCNDCILGVGVGSKDKRFDTSVNLRALKSEPGARIFDLVKDVV